MSDNTPPQSPAPPTPEVSAVTGPRRSDHRVARFFGWIFISLAVLVLVVIFGLNGYTGTQDFQNRVGGQVKSSLEDSIGGKVDIGHIRFNLWHLAIEVDNLVIHGTEAAGEAPYLSAAKIFVHLKLNTFLNHTVGKGAQSRIGLNYLRVEQPHAHLIIDKDGKTNQPVPKQASTSTEPIQNSLLDLQAKEVELADGLVLINDRPIPFNVAARDLNARVQYLAKTDRYGIDIALADLQTQIAKQPLQDSKLHLNLELGRDAARLKNLDFYTGHDSHLAANADIQHLAQPEWQANVTGSVSLVQIGLLGGVEGLTSGVLNLDIHGHNCDATPQQAQQVPKSPSTPIKAQQLPPDPDCQKGYLLLGNINLQDASYATEDVHLHSVNVKSQLSVTPTELLFNALTGRLPGGGTIDGDLKIENWLGQVPSSAPSTSPTTVAAAKTANNAAKTVGAAPPVQTVNVTPVQRSHAFAKVVVKGITLRTILAITGPNKLGDLGLDTQVSGPVTAEWGGPATNIADTVQVGADLKLAPYGERRQNTTNVPVSGRILAHYDGSTQIVNLGDVNLQTPGTTLTAKGILGINNGDPLTNLALDLNARDLAEFDRTLQALGVSANGKKGTAALPVVLHGSLAFNGTAKGSVRNLDIKGHLAANAIEVKLGTTTDVLLDSVVADAEYEPSRGIAVAGSTIKRGTAVLNVTGSAMPHRVSHRGVVSYNWDNATAIRGTVKLADAQIPDLLQVAGQQNNIQLTGTANINAKVAGTLGNLNGDGNVILTNGVAYGQPYSTMSVDANVLGQQITATRLLVAAQGVTVTGNGSYNLASKHITAQLAGQDIRLSKLDIVKKQNIPADAVLTFNASANGTAEEPNLKATLSLADLSYADKQLGQLNLTAHSTGSTIFYDLTSQLVGAQIAANGQTSLKGDYQTQAKLTLSGVDVAKAVALFQPGATDATSDIAATVSVSGPAAKPQLLAGSATFSHFSLTSQGITLQQTEPIQLALHNGVVAVDDFHVTGPDTTLRVSGTATVFGDNSPDGGPVNIHADGTLDLAIAHNLAPQLLTSGKVTLNAGVGGHLKNPALTGEVRFDNANLAIDGIPNGLSNLQGVAVFNQNRLELRNITGTSGGGKLTLGGYVGYQRGLFSDLTARLDHVRVRYAGLSTTADATIRLQGGGQALFLSGNVLITRFGVGADVDFARFAGTGGVSVPPDPTSILNKIRMDIHIASSPQLDFQNSYAKISGTVDLNVRGTVAVPSILGTVRITDGSATFAGTTYQLERGVIYFTDPVRINPIIDLDVTTRVQNYNVTIGVHGDTTNLKPIYRSSPPLTEADIFNLLALGKTQEQSQLSSQQQVQAGTDPTTSAILSGALNATVGSRVGKLFGAGSVKLDPSYTGTLGNSTARITVQEPLTNQLTLVFATNINESAQQLIQVQYQISDDTTLVATRDESGVFSIVYRLRKRYK